VICGDTNHGGNAVWAMVIGLYEYIFNGWYGDNTRPQGFDMQAPLRFACREQQGLALRCSHKRMLVTGLPLRGYSKRGGSYHPFISVSCLSFFTFSGVF
jgi:hypothetical protein